MAKEADPPGSYRINGAQVEFRVLATTGTTRRYPGPQTVTSHLAE
jgi:hypothetical protein